MAEQRVYSHTEVCAVTFTATFGIFMIAKQISEKSQNYGSSASAHPLEEIGKYNTPINSHIISKRGGIDSSYKVDETQKNCLGKPKGRQPYRVRPLPIMNQNLRIRRYCRWENVVAVECPSC